jgi:hypothetical protein
MPRTNAPTTPAILTGIDLKTGETLTLSAEGQELQRQLSNYLRPWHEQRSGRLWWSKSYAEHYAQQITANPGQAAKHMAALEARLARLEEDKKGGVRH